MQRNLRHRMPVTSGSSYVRSFTAERECCAEFLRSITIITWHNWYWPFNAVVGSLCNWWISLVYLRVHWCDFSFNISKSWPVTPLNAAAAGRKYLARRRRRQNDVGFGRYFWCLLRSRWLWHGVGRCNVWCVHKLRGGYVIRAIYCADTADINGLTERLLSVRSPFVIQCRRVSRPLLLR